MLRLSEKVATIVNAWTKYSEKRRQVSGIKAEPESHRVNRSLHRREFQKSRSFNACSEAQKVPSVRVYLGNLTEPKRCKKG